MRDHDATRAPTEPARLTCSAVAAPFLRPRDGSNANPDCAIQGYGEQVGAYTGTKPQKRRLAKLGAELASLCSGNQLQDTISTDAKS
jgi:hypothetical protein